MVDTLVVKFTNSPPTAMLIIGVLLLIVLCAGLGYGAGRDSKGTS